MKKQKLVWISDVPWANSGMGIQSKLIVEHLASLGYDIYYIAWYAGNPGEKTHYTLAGKEIKVYFLGQNSFGTPALIENIISLVKPDMIVSFGDMHMVNAITMIDKKWHKNWLHWWTVDNDSPSDFELAIAQKIPKLVALTNFGANIIKKYTNRVVPVIGHAYRSRLGIGERKTAKRSLGIGEDTVVFGCIARNFWRKNLHTFVNAFAHRLGNTKDAVLLIHTDDPSPGKDGCNLVELVKKLKLQGRVFVTTNAVSEDDMTCIIDAMDFHVLPSFGEGFGVPVIETMARGVPNIVPRHTTLPELVGDSGYIIPLSISGSVHPNTGREYLGPDCRKLSDVLSIAYALRMVDEDAYLNLALKAMHKVQEYAPEAIVKKWELLIENFNDIPTFENSPTSDSELKPRFRKETKKILLCSMFYVPNLIGGGEYTAHEFMKGLQNNGWDTKVITLFDGIKGQVGAPLNDQEIMLDGVSIIQSGKDWYKYLIDILDNDPPDILMTYEISGWYSLRFLREAKKRNIKTVMYEQYWRLLTNDFNNISTQIPNPPRQGLECSKLTDQLITNSDFTRNMFQKILGRTTPVVYPPMSFPKTQPLNTKKYIVMVNPSKAKGVDVVFHLASKFPSAQFRLVGSLGEDSTFLELKKYSNIEHCPHTDDMDEIYASALVVLFPSTLEESFGRVPVEAMSYGIPVIARNIGAVESVLEDTAILVAKDAELCEWETALKSLLDNPSKAVKMGNASQKFVLSKFDPQKQIANFTKILTDLLSEQQIIYHPSRIPKIVMVCDTNFDGVKTALEYAEQHFPNQAVFCPCYSWLGKDRLLDITQMIEANHSPAIMYSGWSNAYVSIIKAVKEKYPHIKQIINWHSPLGQTEMSGELDINAFVRCNQMLIAKEVDYIAVPFEKEATLFRQYFHKNYRWFPDTIAPIYTTQKDKKDDGYFKIGFFALPSARKNILSQLSAIRLLHLNLAQKSDWKGAKLIIGNGFDKHTTYINFLEMLDIPYEILPYFQNKQDYYNNLASVHVNLQVTFSEAFNYVCAESLMLGIPCLGSKMTPALTSHLKEIEHVLKLCLIIDNIDDTNEVFEKLHALAIASEDNYSKVCNIGKSHMISVMHRHNAAIKLFLDEMLLSKQDS